MIIASVYEGFKRIRIFRYSFHSFRWGLDFRIIRITPGCRVREPVQAIFANNTCANLTLPGLHGSLPRPLVATLRDCTGSNRARLPPPLPSRIYSLRGFSVGFFESGVSRLRKLLRQRQAQRDYDTRDSRCALLDAFSTSSLISAPLWSFLNCV